MRMRFTHWEIFVDKHVGTIRIAQIAIVFLYRKLGLCGQRRKAPYAFDLYQ
jgi:hypothetical protein